MQQLARNLTNIPAVDRLVTLWASILNPFIAKPILNGNLIKNVGLINGTNVIYHNLGQLQQGWEITDLNAAATIYRSAAFNDTTLTLTSSAACTVSIWCF